jgi:thiol:disulfide interchange protein DsbD
MKMALLPWLAAAMLCLAQAADAKPWWMRGVESNRNDFLPPDEAFRVTSRVDGDVIRIRWVIADGYYLYRQRMEVKAESPDLVVAEPNFPHGTRKTDPYEGTQEIFTQEVEGTASYTRSDAGAHPIQVKVSYQGCALAGLCYPVITKVLFPAVAAGAGAPAGPIPGAPAGATAGPTAELSTLPRGGGKYAIVGGMLAFLIAGLLLRKERRLDLPT